MNTVNPLNSRPSSPALTLRVLATPLAAAILLALPATSHARLFVSINVAPPPLVVYEQPAMPGVGYMWTPGYWAYGGEGYFWVPGTWVRPPYSLALWTPGYWGYGGNGYAFHSGYWGQHIGFYGGINYGYGYGGVGYQGGYWNHGGFYYNRGYNNFGGVRVTNVYNRTIINNTTINNHVSFNGGAGGIAARPSREEMIATHERHTQAVAEQQQHVRMASQNREMFASVNHGAPAIAATRRPGEFDARAHDARAEDPAARMNPSPEANQHGSLHAHANPPHNDRRELRNHDNGQAIQTIQGRDGSAHGHADAPRNQNPEPRNHSNGQAMQTIHGNQGNQGNAGQQRGPGPMARQQPPQQRAPAARSESKDRKDR